jgi:1-deoxy-D-xylulose-5-phosphate reductoisomerase
MTFPRRVSGLAEPLRWDEIRTLSFEPPDFARFPALWLGYEAARRGGTSGAVLNAANEAAVTCFRKGEIGFGQIAALAEQVLRRHRRIEKPTLEQLLECDAWARQEVDACRRLRR